MVNVKGERERTIPFPKDVRQAIGHISRFTDRSGDHFTFQYM